MRSCEQAISSAGKLRTRCGKTQVTARCLHSYTVPTMVIFWPRWVSNVSASRKSEHVSDSVIVISISSPRTDNQNRSCHCFLFTALYGMQTRSSDENSVCLSVTRVNCENGRKICPDLYTVVFWEEWMVGGGTTASTWNFGSTDPHCSEIADF